MLGTLPTRVVIMLQREGERMIEGGGSCVNRRPELFSYLQLLVVSTTVQCITDTAHLCTVCDLCPVWCSSMGSIYSEFSISTKVDCFTLQNLN